ncbi:hypothetical protein [Paenibacillus sp. GP183]|uniref:hypothetical protein n=1 Tax=Paenibacillus sp. GP183 TaxID=1882751 RepID=UPI000896647D|nr:hypothetical protein [Paenibacillus sp. GP183]SED17833.1 hypothetical protein SAMN05443246_5966 [Paenibacillus sp. GP183]
MKNVWLMKTYKEWSERFLQGNFIAIDEKGVDQDNYGNLTKPQRKALFEALKAKNTSRRYGHIQRFFDQFYDEVLEDDVLVLGTGQTTKFLVTAIVRIKGTSYFYPSPSEEDSRHRFEVEVLWAGDPFEVPEWGWANRLEKMDTPDRLKQFIQMYMSL